MRESKAESRTEIEGKVIDRQIDRWTDGQKARQTLQDESPHPHNLHPHSRRCTTCSWAQGPALERGGRGSTGESITWAILGLSRLPPHWGLPGLPALSPLPWEMIGPVWAALPAPPRGSSGQAGRGSITGLPALMALLQGSWSLLPSVQCLRFIILYILSGFFVRLFQEGM